MGEIDTQMYAVLTTVHEINAISNSFEGIGPVFGSVSLALPKLVPRELGFIRSVSWLYVQFFEAGKLGSEYLLKVSAGLALESADPTWRDHLQRLRTYCQHNLDPGEDHSKEVQQHCEKWFRSHCGTHVPGDEEHWGKLLLRLLLEANTHVSLLREVLRKLEKEDAASQQQLLLQWRLRIERYRAPHEFDRIVKIVASDLGRDAFDAVKFRKKHYDRWIKAFQVLSSDCDFDVEARKLVESSILSEQQDLLPITGRDVMQSLNVPPGVQVGVLLEKAKQLFAASPSSKDELLARLEEHARASANG